MIVHLRGTLTSLSPTRAVIEIAGVGYEAMISKQTYEALLPQEGKETFLEIQEIIREDTHQLYGFSSPEEKTLFLLLTNLVSGVGPKLASNFLSGGTTAELKRNIGTGDSKALSKIKGIGAKTAERICLELHDKVGGEIWGNLPQIAGAINPVKDTEDTILALIALGYKQADAKKAAESAKSALPDGKTEDLLKIALRCLA